MKKGMKIQNPVKKIILQSKYYKKLYNIKKEAEVFEEEQLLEKQVYEQIKKPI